MLKEFNLKSQSGLSVECFENIKNAFKSVENYENENKINSNNYK